MRQQIVILLNELSRERRPVEVYVLTSVPGRTFVSQDASDAGGGVSVGSMTFATASAPWQSDSALPLHSLGPLSMKGATMAELCRTIEDAVGRPVIDESGLDGGSMSMSAVLTKASTPSSAHSNVRLA